MTACIIGWAHTPFGKLADETVETLSPGWRARRSHMPGSRPSDIDEIYLGHFNAGFSAQDFTASLVLQADDDFRFKPATRVENACATGSAAVHQGIKAIRAGAAQAGAGGRRRADDHNPGPPDRRESAEAPPICRRTATPRRVSPVSSARSPTAISRSTATSPTAWRRLRPRTTRTASIIPGRKCARIWATSFAAPRATRIPYVAGPLKRTDCSLVSDGAAAIVLSDVTSAMQAPRAILFRAAEHVQDFLPMSKRDILSFEGCALGWKRAFANSKTSLDDLSFVETHDCFTIAELIEYEAMGLAKPGQGGAMAMSGETARRMAGYRSIRRAA
jgi:acetyl-CoA C-acetyltransferase